MTKTRKYSICFCWKESGASRARCSANMRANTPQSQPFNCLGMFFGYLHGTQSSENLILLVAQFQWCLRHRSEFKSLLSLLLMQLNGAGSQNQLRLRAPEAQNHQRFVWDAHRIGHLEVSTSNPLRDLNSSAAYICNASMISGSSSCGGAEKG